MEEIYRNNPQSQDNLKLVFVGHIDHGKSTLIGRMLYDTGALPESKIEEIKMICESLGKDMEFGFIMDNLEEERDQGITIDTAHIYFNSKKRNYTIIDAPGHVEFIKNMITGASQAEAAILIVDAQEGVEEQTKRHAYILGMLGLKQVIAVINKMDLVEYSQERFRQVSSDLISFLDQIDIKPAHIIPVSAKEGDNITTLSKNMDWYDAITVIEALDTFKTSSQDDTRPLRFAVQDIYKHDKRIVVGRVEAGTMKVDDEIVILPSGEKTVIASIEEFQKTDVKEAKAGKATGIVTKDKVFIDRGNIITHGKVMPVVSDTFKAHLFWMDKEPLKLGERLVLKLATQESVAKVTEFNRVIDSSTLEVLNQDEIQNRQVADVTIKTDEPIVVENFNDVEELGRFVLERLNTVAGGIITDVGDRK